ncbi:glycosyltransferase family 2 protein [Streptococcus equinus]|uniref:glycosyltransferase family 2 protein n=1 Tax=Streptococcus equinus TaxID=1335 RepID=UPI0008E84A20|nr:glycosyltransferase family 2 protein [Streptococcus equinus]SFG22516.1 Glycosyltransferase, GT2 family [Streptococcus equinus]
MKKVSVIIPTYKRSAFLVRAIESVLNQTYKNIELIIVDDNDSGSIYRKENERKLDSYVKSNKVIYLKHETNKNGASARNTGLKIAKGDYITFLDDDDFYLKDRIELLVKKMEQNSNIDCVYSSMLKIKNNHVYNYRIATEEGNFLKEVLSQNSFFGTGSNMFFTRKAIIQVGLFDESFFRLQDLEYMTRFFENGFSVGAVNKILVVKCEEDTLNYPNYENMKLAKLMYINKFQDSLDLFDREKLIYDIYKELYLFSLGQNHRDSIKVLSKYGKLNLKDIILHMYIRLTRSKKLFSKFDFIIRELYCFKKYTIQEREEIFSLINTEY